MFLLQRNLLIVSTFAFLALFFFGCSSSGSMKNLFKENDYEKMLKTQRERQNAVKNEDGKLPDTFPQVTEEGYEKLGDYHLSLGNIDMAYIQYQNALQLKPEQIRIRYKLGRLYLKRGLHEEAEAEFRKILLNAPDNAFAYDGLGRVYFKRGNFQESEKNFRQATELDSGLWQAYVFMGIILDRQRNFEGAIKEYKRAVSLKPDNADILNNLAISYYFSGEYESAVKSLTEAVKTGSPKRGTYYNNLGIAFCKLGKYSEALDAFKKSGDEAAAYNNIGYILMKDGKYDEAIKIFERALDINSTFYIKAHENLLNSKAALKASSSEQ